MSRPARKSSALLLLVALSLVACSGGSISTPGDAAADATPAPLDGGPDAAPGDAGGDPFERCKANAGIDRACASEGVQVIIAGPKIGCFSEKSFASSGVRFEIGMDTSFAAQLLRLGRPTDVGGKDGTVWTFRAPAPIPLQSAPIPKDLQWPAELVTFAFAGAFSFLEASYPSVDLALDAPLTLAEAGQEKVVVGRVKLSGGTYVRADKNAQRYTVVDPDARGEACFRVPSGVRTL
jgi:hypothetical protein